MKTIINTVKTSIQAFIRDEEGNAAIEYVLVAALISVTIAAGLTAVEDELNSQLDAIALALVP